MVLNPVCYCARQASSDREVSLRRSGASEAAQPTAVLVHGRLKRQASLIFPLTCPLSSSPSVQESHQVLHLSLPVQTV